jgi:hypothetical protein
LRGGEAKRAVVIKAVQAKLQLRGVEKVGGGMASTPAHALAGSRSTHGTTNQSGAGENRMEVRSINPWGVGIWHPIIV